MKDSPRYAELVARMRHATDDEFMADLLDELRRRLGTDARQGDG